MQLSPEPEDQLHEPETQNGNLEVCQCVKTQSHLVNTGVQPDEKAPTDGVRFNASYAFDVFRGLVEKMRKPLSWFFFLWVFAWVVSSLTPTLRTAFSPLCTFPGISRSALCVPIGPPSPVNFDMLVNLQSYTLEQLAGESARGSELSIGVMRAEMATQDLSVFVRSSDLKSRDNIADMLRTVAADAKKTGRGLTRLNAKVVGAIDDVMALNTRAMATIEGAHKEAPSPLLQAISPYKLGPTADEIIAEVFDIVMGESGQTFEKLIIEADTSRQNLELMDVDIRTLLVMIAREGKHTTAEKNKISSEWKTWLGWNKEVVRDFEDRLALLNDLEGYRKQAYAHVMAALRTLHTMSDDLEVVRERVAAPSLLGSKLPLHVHIESIKDGLERLQEARMKSRGRGVKE